MFAVIKTGGKQYRVAKGDVIKVEKLAAAPGSEILLDQVLLVGDSATRKVGAPLVEDAAVKAEVISQKKDRKIIVFKKKRRHNYRRKKGHRQEITLLKIVDIHASDAKKLSVKKATVKKAVPKTASKKATAKKTAGKATAKTVAKKAPKKTTSKKAAVKKPVAKKD